MCLIASGIGFFVLIKRQRGIAVCLLAAAVALFYFSYVRQTKYLPLQALNDQEAGAVLRVEGQPKYYSWGTQLICRVQSNEVSGVRGGFRVWVSAFDLYDFEPDDEFYAVLKFQKNHKTQTGADIALGRGCYISASVGKQTVVDLESSRRTFYGLTSDYRQSVLIRLRGFAKGEGGELLSAVCFADRSGISDELSQVFAVCGISHLLALSGLHLGIFSSILFFVLRKAGVNSFAVTVVSAVCSLLFAAFVGLSPSVLRALILIWYTMAAKLLFRDVDPPTVLALACILLTVPNPYSILNPALILSVLSCAGVMLLYRRLSLYLQQHFDLSLHGAAEAVLLSLCILLATMAYSVWVFGYVSAFGVLLNVLFVPLYSVLISFGIVAGLLAPLPVFRWLTAPLIALLGHAAEGSILLARALYPTAAGFLLFPTVKEAIIITAAVLAGETLLLVALPRLIRWVRRCMAIGR